MLITRVFAIFLIGWLQYSLWFGKNGIYEYSKIKKKIMQNKIENIILKKRNNAIKKKIEILKKNYK